MELNFYSLSVLYLVYSFLGWVGETVVATIKGRRFANRGVASGPFCFIYGFTAVLLAISFADRPSPLLLFLGCAIDATVVEWLTAKLLERVNRRRWWDYSGKRFNVDGYICLQYSLLWGALGTATVLWGNGLLFKLYGLLPQWLVRPLLWVSPSRSPCWTSWARSWQGAATPGSIRTWNSSMPSWKSTPISSAPGSAAGWSAVSRKLTRPPRGGRRPSQPKRL